MDLVAQTTPRKVLVKNIDEIYAICIICCVDITSKEGHARRKASTFQHYLQEGDEDYDELFKQISANELYICKNCFAILKKIEANRKKNCLTKTTTRNVCNI
jgi:hypothetical protein